MAGGIFGISVYFRNKLGEFESNAKKHIQDAIDKITKEKWYN